MGFWMVEWRIESIPLTRPCVQKRRARPPSPEGKAQGWRAQVETCGQIACSVGRLPIRFTVGTGGVFIDKHKRHDQDESTGSMVETVGMCGLL